MQIQLMKDQVLQVVNREISEQTILFLFPKSNLIDYSAILTY